MTGDESDDRTALDVAEHVASPRPHEVDDDLDSALGEEVRSDNTSLASAIFEHRKENGRTYHRYRGGENDYWGPNDEQQNDQLDIGHHMLTLLLDNKLYLAPIDSKQCRHVLDLGCGTGIWAMDFADIHPDCEVIGVDLSPIQPSMVPPNCHFVIDDITDDWTYPSNHFDFIHLRCLMGSISDWPGLYRHIYNHLKPGGWIQHLDMNIHFTSDDGTVGEGHIMDEWSKVFIDCGERIGKTFQIADKSEDWIRKAGFEEVNVRWYKVPVGRWPKDRHMKEVGICNFHYCYEGAEGWALYLLTKVLGWKVEEAQVFVAKFRSALKDGKNHTYYRICVLWARKPQVSEPSRA